MLNLAQLKGKHNIDITCNGDVKASGLETAGEAIDFINANLASDDFKRIVDANINSDTIVMVFRSNKGIVKQFLVEIDIDDTLPFVITSEDSRSKFK